MFEEGSKDILDSQHFRTLYIAQVFESKAGGGPKKKLGENDDA